jgi:capsular exopolysaccharide synthesis family protein
MVVFFLAVIFVVVTLTFLSEDSYLSRGKLLVRLGRESVTLDPTAATGQIIHVSQSRESEIKAELEILTSKELLEKVVDSVGPATFLSDPDEGPSAGGSGRRTGGSIRRTVGGITGAARNLLERLSLVEPVGERDKVVLAVMKNLEIAALERSSIIEISFKANRARLAQTVVTKLIELYLEKHIIVHQTPGSYEFFVQQSKQLRDKLLESEKQLRNLKNTTGISEVPEQRRVVLERIGLLKEQIGQTEAALASSRANVQSLEKAFSDIPKTIVTEQTTGFPNFGTDAMREQLFKLQVEKAKLLANFTEESPMVKAVQKEIDQAQALLAKEDRALTQVTQGLSAAHQQLQLALITERANVSALEAKVEAQKKHYADAEAELKILNDAEFRIAGLRREIGTEEINYRKYSENLEQARIDQAMENQRISNISVVQPATLAVKSIGPRKLLNLAIGFIVGIFGSIGLALVSEYYLDHSIRTPEEAEQRLHLPMLAAIPRVRLNRISSNGVLSSPKRSGRVRSRGESAQGSSAQWTIPAAIKEHFETFRERLLPRSNGSVSVPQIVAVTSCRRGEGVSTVAANLAATLSRHGNEPVLLVDADTNDPAVHTIFRTSLEPGLAHVISRGFKSADAIVSSPVQNLHILSAGTTNGNLSDIFDSDGFSKLLGSIKSGYRFVVIDVPALNETSSAIRLASLCDGVILVVEAERLRREIARRAKEQLMKLNANVLGVVLNKRRFHIPGWLYRTL